MKTIVIGLGNPILTDDGVGVKAARLLKERLNGANGLNGAAVEVKELYVGGLALMDALTGYERAILIDAALTGSEPGTIHELSPSGLPATRNTFSTHDTNLPTALEVGRTLGLSLPEDIKIIAVEAADVETFSEELTEKVEKAVPVVVDRIFEMLNIEMLNIERRTCPPELKAKAERGQL